MVRYYLAAAHYRSVLDYHEGALAEAETAFARIETFLDRAAQHLDGSAPPSAAEVVPPAFAAALDDDLAMPEALAVLHESVRAGNAALDREELAMAAEIRGQVTAMVQVLGIDPHSSTWQTGVDMGAQRALAALVERLIADRQDARVTRDFARADQIRHELAAAGITIEDSATGTHWSINGE